MKKYLGLSLLLIWISCSDHQGLNEIEKEDFLKKGKSIAELSQKALGKQLMNQIQFGGAEHAMNYCNLKAIHITDSLSTVLKADIKRLSDLNRNPVNRADQVANRYIASGKERLKSKQVLEPYIAASKDSVRMLFPIQTNTLCLQCHGQPNKEIKPSTLMKIEALYPDDLAKNYDVNQLRGVWSITMTRE